MILNILPNRAPAMPAATYSIYSIAFGYTIADARRKISSPVYAAAHSKSNADEFYTKERQNEKQVKCFFLICVIDRWLF